MDIWNIGKAQAGHAYWMIVHAFFSLAFYDPASNQMMVFIMLHTASIVAYFSPSHQQALSFSPRPHRGLARCSLQRAADCSCFGLCQCFTSKVLLQAVPVRPAFGRCKVDSARTFSGSIAPRWQAIELSASVGHAKDVMCTKLEILASSTTCQAGQCNLTVNQRSVTKLERLRSNAPML